MNNQVQSFNDFDPLEEIIVGTPTLSNLPPLDQSLRNFSHLDGSYVAAMKGPCPQQVVEETAEDLEIFVSALRQHGVTVRQPAPYDNTAAFSTPFWQTEGLHSFMPRDCILVVGDDIIEVPMSVRSRFFETWAFRDILLDYFDQGAKWTVAPRPRLRDDTYLAEGGLADVEPLFDAANILRVGKDLFFNTGKTANSAGCKWLQRHLGDAFRVHKMNIWKDHIDTTLVPLRPGTILVNPDRVTEESLPEPLKDWDVIWAPQPVVQDYHLDWMHCSHWIGNNLVSLDHDTVVVEESQVNLIRVLEQRGFTVVPVPHRHARSYGGGFHCITLDIRRKGNCEDYFH